MNHSSPQSQAGRNRRIEVERHTLDTLDSSVWDNAVAANPHGTYAQTSYYGRFEEAVNDYSRAHFLSASCDGQTAGQMLAIEKFSYELLLQRSALARRLGALPARFLRSLSWNYGPLIAQDMPAGETLASLLDAVDSLAAERGIYMVSYALPPVYGWSGLAAEYAPAFASAGYSSRRKATVLLRIESRSVDELWDGLTKDSRRVVRKARREGVGIIEAESEAHMEAFHQLRLETARRNGFRLPDREHFLRMGRIFPVGTYKVFLSSHEGRWVSGQGVGVTNGNLVLGGVSYSDYARENKIYGNDLMQWHIIEWAHANSARYLDWVGYFLEPANSGEKGVNQFKLKWGGEVVEYDEFYKVYGNIRNSLVHLAKKLLA